MITIIIKGEFMSDIAIQSEINKLIQESGYKKDKKMLCSITRVFKMRYPSLDNLRVCKLANQILK
jgi:hypothetical protein